MKGISAIISVVLILMITIVLAGLSYIWFTNLFQSVTSTAQQTATGAQTALATKFKIEAATNTTLTNVTVYVRNTGQADINMTTASAYVNDIFMPTDGNKGITLSPGSVSTFNVTNVNNPCNKILRVTVGTGASDTISITC